MTQWPDQQYTKGRNNCVTKPTEKYVKYFVIISMFVCLSVWLRDCEEERLVVVGFDVGVDVVTEEVGGMRVTVNMLSSNRIYTNLKACRTSSTTIKPTFSK